MKSGSRMEEWKNALPILGAYLAPNTADALFGEIFIHGIAAEGDNEVRAQQFNLAVKVFGAGSNLCGQRVAIIGGTAFDHIGNEDIFPLEPNASQ